jgi:hypothetical protein
MLSLSRSVIGLDSGLGFLDPAVIIYIGASILGWWFLDWVMY